MLGEVTSMEYTAVLLGIGLVAGFLGSLTGMGGGVIVTPALTLLLGIDMRYAMGASLLSAIATSSGAASAYVREGYSNVRIGMFLEVATTFGALGGAFLALHIPTSALGVVFGCVLAQSAWLAAREPAHASEAVTSDPLAVRLRMDSDYPTPQGLRPYHVQRVKMGFSLMFGAGAISGLLGIGSGSLKVIAMDRAMRMPFKVSTTTSNFMIGVTAAASAGVYLNRGYLNPSLAMPVILGVLAGSLGGARVMAGASTKVLRLVFAGVAGFLAVEMIASGLRGKL
jgi:uncharacterized protein